jgi:SulP family sulfate permease
VVPFFGGMPATGTVARTVTNIRAGAVSPVAGIVHAATLAAVVLLAAPLAMHIPLAVLAGVLLFVAWNMGEWREFARLKQFSNHYRIMLLSTFVLTIVFDLTVAVELGMVLAIVLFVRRQSALFSADIDEHQEQRIEGRLYGALFFGSVAKLDALQHAADTANDALVMRLDARQLISLDTSGLDALEQLQRSLGKHGGRLVLRGLQAQPRSLLERSGFAQHIDLED